jgi:hypothetical protein
MHEPARNDAELLHEALCNEKRLDQRYKTTFRAKGRFLDYKVMKQVAWKRKLGPLLTPALVVVAWLMPVLLLARWLRMLVGAFSASPVSTGRTAWIVPTTPTNESLIRGGLAGSGVDLPVVSLDDLASELPRRLGWRAVLAAGGQATRLLWRILTSSDASRTALLLHARDALSLLLLADFARAHPDDVFATDCHYQRWSFTLSHTARGLRLVQHGLLDLDIGLPYRGGRVRQVLVWDDASAEGWRRYYRLIDEAVVHAPRVALEPNSHSRSAVFLASSFPTIDEEIAFIRALRQASATPLIVKLHPAHRYDGRRSQLLEFANHVCRPDENPACAVFISHSSSMEMIYRNHGIRTVSLRLEDTATAAVEATLLALNETSRHNEKLGAA